MNAILITGNTYPHRRELARLGGRWSAERGGYLFAPEFDLSALPEGRWITAATRIEIDPAELAPPTYADKRAAQADRHTRRAERLDARADSRDRTVQAIGAKLAANPLVSDYGLATEPIKVGHHSEGRHRRAKERIGQQMGAQVVAWREGAELRGRAAAEAARGMPDAERSVGFMVRRMDELTAALRRAERELVGGSFHGHDRSGGLTQTAPDPDSPWGRKVAAERDQAAEGLAYWQALLDAAGGVAYSKDNVKPGMIIAVSFGQARVIRTGTKNASVVYTGGNLDGYASKIPYANIVAIIEEVTS